MDGSVSTTKSTCINGELQALSSCFSDTVNYTHNFYISIPVSFVHAISSVSSYDLDMHKINYSQLPLLWLPMIYSHLNAHVGA